MLAFIRKITVLMDTEAISSITAPLLQAIYMLLLWIILYQNEEDYIVIFSSFNIFIHSPTIGMAIMSSAPAKSQETILYE